MEVQELFCQGALEGPQLYRLRQGILVCTEEPGIMEQSQVQIQEAPEKPMGREAMGWGRTRGEGLGERGCRVALGRGGRIAGALGSGVMQDTDRRVGTSIEIVQTSIGVQAPLARHPEQTEDETRASGRTESPPRQCSGHCWTRRTIARAR